MSFAQYVTFACFVKYDMIHRKVMVYRDAPLEEVLSEPADDTETLLRVRAWEVEESPTDLGYRWVKDWAKMPADWRLGQVVNAAMDTKGRYYVLHRGRDAPSIICFDRESGEVLHAWGEDVFKFAHSLRCDKNDNLWMVDSASPRSKTASEGGHYLYLYSPEGKVLKTLGTKGEWGEDGTHFRGPTDIAWNVKGEFYVSDGYINTRIARFDKNFKFIAQWGCEGTGNGQFTLPHALTIDAEGLVYVCDRTTWRVEIFSPEGAFLRQWTHVGRCCDIQYMPDDHLMALDGPTRRITKLDRSGNIVGFFDTIKGAHGFGLAPNGDIITCNMDGTFQLFSQE
jgi:hypothetical protein